MSITDKLRDYATVSWNPWPEARDRLLQMCDHIDAEHEKAITSVMNDALYHANEKDMAELGWIRLPKDADNVPWHIGDRDEDGNTVTAIKLGLDGFWIRVGCTYRIAKQARHYQPDSWELIIEHAMEAGKYTVGDTEARLVVKSLVKRCNALAGDTK